MSLQIEEREIEGITLLDLKGSLTLGDGVPELRERLAVADTAEKVNVIVNLKDVGDIDSAGFGALVFGQARLRRCGGRLALVNLNRWHVKLFLLTRLSIAFEFFGDEHEAVNSFFPDRDPNPFDILSFVQSQEDARLSPDALEEATC